jgi:hypothetical protein
LGNAHHGKIAAAGGIHHDGRHTDEFPCLMSD